MKKTMNVSNETKLKYIIASLRKCEKFIEDKEDHICYAIIFKECIFTKNFTLLKNITNDFFVTSFDNILYLTIFKQ